MRASIPQILKSMPPRCRLDADENVDALVASLREQILDIAIAECESDIQPNRVPDDLRGKLVAVSLDGSPLLPAFGAGLNVDVRHDLLSRQIIIDR